MGALSRIRRLLQANLYDALDRAEDPAKMLNFLIIEMQESIEQARDETATVMAAERRLAQQADEADHAALQWYDRAHFALERGEDELAREALRRRVTAAEMAMHYHRAHQTQVQAVAELRTVLDRLEQRLQEAKVRRIELLAQLGTMHAHQVIARSFRQTVGYEAFDDFDRIAGKIADEKNRAVALTRLSSDEVNDAFLIAEGTDAIERELLNMKHELGYLDVPPEPKALKEHDSSQ